MNDISENVEEIKQKNPKAIVKRIGETFAKQQQQAEIIMEHKKQCSYPKIVCGDMNNSAFSYVYRIIKGDMHDTFEEAGKVSEKPIILIIILLELITFLRIINFR